MGNANLQAPFTEGQLLGLQIVRSIVSIPSIIAATYIIQHVLRSPKRRQRTATRIILGMSTMDLMFACITTLSASIIPAEFSRVIVFASGTWKTCEAFGFLQHGAAISSAVYNGSLTLYYLLTIRYRWTDRQTHRIEGWLHVVPLLIGWGTSIPGLPLTLYNPGPVGCTIGEYPAGCGQRNNCKRGDDAALYRILFTFLIIWAVFAFLVVAMTMIYRTILSIERASEPSMGANFRMDSDSSPSQQQAMDLASSRRQRSKRNSLRQRFAMQALLYCVAFALSYLFGTINVINVEWGNGIAYIPILFLQVMLLPLQGVWNALIYIRPRYLRYRDKQRQLEGQEAYNASRFQSAIRAMSVAVEDEDEDEDAEYEATSVRSAKNANEVLVQSRTDSNTFGRELHSELTPPSTPGFGEKTAKNMGSITTLH
jgi:hypothetical protein